MDYEWLYEQLVQEINLYSEVADMLVEARSIETNRFHEINNPAYMWAKGRKDLIDTLKKSIQYNEHVSSH